MYPPSNAANAPGVYGLRCIKCGGALELPHDPALLMIDCPFCGQDNVLPAYLVEARQQQYRIAAEQQAQVAASHAAAARAAASAAATASSARLKLFLFGGIGLFTMLMMGTCVALGVKASRDEQEKQARVADPKLNIGDGLHPIDIRCGPPVFDPDVAPVHPTKLVETLGKRRQRRR